MIWKLLIFIVILVLVYLVFFRKRRVKNGDKKDEIADTLIECKTCGTYITKDEAILSNGKHFCSKECLNK
ncbi:PP0621 family protein [Arcobacter sp. FWKO B]|uniref:PP0621 family protein n=1 Tax=Arcobacter sp. FWKO B TaxID=2593672 RepID=UPI0018A40082|nr:PP0621 family protein [Arcobacter sp. FWKO B]QOG13195.1 hypothetical protein FWKOB_11060 [Arcobacter sp. FWKO B]